jgi:hypothetical protein
MEARALMEQPGEGCDSLSLDPDAIAHGIAGIHDSLVVFCNPADDSTLSASAS